MTPNSNADLKPLSRQTLRPVEAQADQLTSGVRNLKPEHRLPRALRIAAQLSCLALPCLLWPVSSAHAQALPSSGYIPSLSSDNSYFLFRTTFDHIQDPSRLGLLDSNALYTQLTNYSGASQYGIGLSAPVGAGGLALLVTGSGSGDELTSVDEEVDQTSGAVKSRTTRTAYNYNQNFSLYAGYGIPLTRFQLGAGLRLSLGRSEYSTDENLTLGGDNIVYEDLESQQTETVEGNIHYQADQYQLILSGGFGDLNALSVQADLTLGMQLNRSLVSMDQKFEDYTATATGAYDLLGNSNELQVGLEVNPTWKFRRDLELQAYAGIEMGRPGLTETDFGYHINDFGGAFDTESDLGLSATPTSLSSMAWTLFVQGNYAASPGVELRLGLGISNRSSESDYNVTSTTETVIESSEPFTTETVDHYIRTSEYRQISAPVALEYRLNEKLKARMGGRFLMSSSRTSSFSAAVSNEVDGESQPIDETQSLDESVSWSPSTQYGIGLEFKPTPRVDTELMMNNYSSFGRSAYSGYPVAIYGSATLHW